MGIMNLRAICPNCGGKIHTQPRGLGHFTWARSWFLVQTGTSCQYCGIALTGKVGPDNKAVLAPNPPSEQEKKTAPPAPKPEQSGGIDVETGQVVVNPKEIGFAGTSKLPAGTSLTVLRFQGIGFDAIDSQGTIWGPIHRSQVVHPGDFPDPAGDTPDPEAVESKLDPLDALDRLGELHAKGVLSDEEFASKKEELLKRI